MERIEFLPSEGPQVKTIISDACSKGEHERCQGIFKIDGQMALCVHPFHLASSQNN